MRRLKEIIEPALPLASSLVGLTDSTALLWRLQMLGVKGLSWINAQRFASDRFPGGGNVFAEFHLAMLAVGLQRPEDLRACQMRLEKLMDSGNEAARVATQWVQGLASLFQNNPATAREEISFCKHEAARLGGSHAQRFVIEDTLAWLT